MAKDMASWSMNRIGGVVGLCLAFASTAFAADRRVPQDYPSIQAAINAASSGDVILVAPGTYNETLSISNKSLTVRGTGSPSLTKIDRFGAGGTVVSISGNTSQTVTFQSMTMTRWSEYNSLVISDKTKVVFDNMRLINGGGGVYLINGADFVGTNNYWILVGSWNWDSGSSPVNSATSGCDVVMADSSFQGCRGRSGGVVRIDTEATATISRSTFNDCQSYYYGGVVYHTGAGRLTLEDSTFLNCRTNAYAGGIVRSDGSGEVLIQNSTASGMSAPYEGAIVSKQSGSLTLRNSTFKDATTQGNWWNDAAGGFVRLGSASLLVEDCVFQNLFDPASLRWGGIIGTQTGAESLVRIYRTRFTNCRSNNGPSGGRGGIIHTTGRALTVLGCTFENPTSQGNCYYGGAISLEGGSYAISASTFDRVFAIYGGSALFISSSTGSLGQCRFLNCSSPNNYREAVHFTGNGPTNWLVESCQFVSGGVYAAGSIPLRIQNCTFVQPTPTSTSATVYAIGSAAPYITDCSFKNQSPSYPSIQLASTNYAVVSGCSFCRPAPQEIFTYFIEKEPCVFEADCASDCDADGIPDSFEITTGLDTDCNNNGIPDSCDFASGGGADCNNNGVLDICEIANGSGADCNHNGVLDSCEPDCDADGIPNSCEIAAGASDCDSNGVPDSCQSDCDNDGIIDACEIAAGAPDCNANGIPDSCEIANGSAAYFNKDGIIDSCQPNMQFAGLELEIVPIVNRGFDDLFPQTAICYRLYARTTVAGAAVVGLFGNPANPLSINATGGFWQSPYGGDLASQIPCNLSGVLPTARYDSWFTIGLSCSANNSAQNTGLDLTAFNNGGGVNDNDGIVFVQPGAAQSIASTSKRVLLAQLTTRNAVLPTGFIDVVGRSASGSAAWEAYRQAIPVPALVDCNGNGIQDAFDIANGTVRDCNQNGVPDTCEFPSASTDCNNNGIPDLCDVISGYSADLNGNFVPDECECSGDVDGNGRVDVDDIIDVIASWGAVGDNPADVNNDNVVGAADLAIVLAGYGNCF